MDRGWIGVRKDGVAYHSETGDAVPRTRSRVLVWRQLGRDVRIRATPPKRTRNLAEWWDWEPVDLPGVRVVLVRKDTGYRS